MLPPWLTLNSIPLSDPLVAAIPNPFTDQTTLHFTAELLPVKLKLYLPSRLGDSFSKDCATPALQFGQGLPAGTYVLHVESASASPRTIRLVKTLAVSG